MGPKFKELYNEYADKWNKLFEKLEGMGVDDDTLNEISELLELHTKVKIENLNE